MAGITLGLVSKFTQAQPKNNMRSSNPQLKLNQLQKDTVSFSGNNVDFAKKEINEFLANTQLVEVVKSTTKKGFLFKRIEESERTYTVDKAIKSLFDLIEKHVDNINEPQDVNEMGTFLKNNFKETGIQSTLERRMYVNYPSTFEKLWPDEYSSREEGELKRIEDDYQDNRDKYELNRIMDNT